VINDQQVGGVEIIAKVTKKSVFECAGVTLQNEQARGITRLDRGLGDGFRGKGVVEVRGFHGKQENGAKGNGNFAGIVALLQFGSKGISRSAERRRNDYYSTQIQQTDYEK